MGDVVTARRVSGYSEATKPGDFWWVCQNGLPFRIHFLCPCGCGDPAGVNVATDNPALTLVWGWDGNLDQPTLTPSIDIKTGCRWHGFLSAGVFKPC